MSRNDDWSYKDLLECLDYLKLSERRFRMFLEQIVHPEVRTGVDQQRLATMVSLKVIGVIGSRSPAMTSVEQRIRLSR